MNRISDQHQSLLQLRGGGVCTSKEQQKPGFLNQQDIGNYQIKSELILQLNEKVEEIKEIQQVANTEKGKEVLMKFVKWFAESDQLFSYFVNDTQSVRMYKNVIMDGFTSGLQIVPTLIFGEKLISLQILKICNCIARILFSYFTAENNNDKIENVTEWQTLIADINDAIESEGEQHLFYNQFCYEVSIIELCIGAIPTKEAQNLEQEGLKNSLIGIFTSVTSLSLSEELTSALKDGAMLLFQRFQRYQSKEKFKFCLHFEQLKWNIINEIEKGGYIANVEQAIKKNFKEIGKLNDWNILYSWIKMVSELMIYKPKVHKIKFKMLAEESGGNIEWEEGCKLRYIKPLAQNSNLAEIQFVESPSKNLEFKLNRIYSNFRLLQGFLMTGEQQLPSFQNYYQINQENGSGQEGQINQELIEQLNQIPFQEMSHYLDNLIGQFLNYLDNYSQLQNKYFVSQSQYVDASYEINNLKIFQNQNQQLYEQINGYFIFGSYFELLANFIKSLQFVQEEKALLQIKEANFISFFYQFQQLGQACQISQENLKEEDLIKALQKFDENIFQEEIANLKKAQKNIDEVINCYGLENKQKSDSFKQTISKVNLYFEKIFTPFKILFEKLPDILQEDQITILRTINIKSFTLDEASTNPNIQYAENQTFYLVILAALKMARQACLDLGEILQENFVFENLLELKGNDQLLFRVSFPTYFDLFYKFHEGNLKVRIQQIQKYHQILEQVAQKLNEDSSINDYERTLQVSTVIQNQIYSVLDTIYTFQQQLLQGKDIIYKKGKKTQEVLQLTFPQLETQINLFLDGFSNFDVNEKTNFKDLVRDLQSSAQTISLQLIQLKGDEVKMIQNEVGKLILLLNYTLSKQNEELNQHEEVINENLKSFAESIKSIWISQQDQIKISSFQNEQEMDKNDAVNQNECLGKVIQENFKQVSQLQNLIATFNTSELSTKIELLSHLKIKTKIHTQIQNIMQANLEKILTIVQSLYDILENASQNQEQDGSFKKLHQQLEEIVKQRNHQQLEQKLSNLICQSLPFFRFSKDSLTKQVKSKQKQTGWMTKINDVIQGNFWRVKEGFIFQCILLQNSLPEQSRAVIAKKLIFISAKETDPRILKTIKNKEVISQMIQSYNKYWNEMESVIEADLQTQLRNLEQIQNDLKICENEQKKEELVLEHQKLEQQIEEQLNNISSIGEAMGIVVKFLKDIKKDLNAIQSKLEKIQQQLNEFGLDIKFLRGKTPIQLFEIRMQKVLQQKQIFDGQSVYVKLRTKELIANQKHEDVEETTLFSDNTQNLGEVDEFLQQQKDSLLIHGPAGSGKSAAAQKIEEFIWIQYQDQQQKNVQLKESKTSSLVIPLIPIFIQLSSLKNPLSEAVEETLQSSSYNFDQKQILEFKEQVAQGRTKVIFILDSYDELSKTYIQQNLNISNKLKSWKFDTTNIQNINQYSQELTIIGYYPKIITTTRSESLQQSNYKEWFLSDQNFDYSKYKEVRILTFDLKQQLEYLQQFSLLQIKLALYELFETLNVSTTTGPKFHSFVEQIWSQVFELIFGKENQNEKVLNDQQIKSIIQLLKSKQNLDIRKEIEEYFSKQLAQLWSVKVFEKYIKEFNLQQLLVTPFMMKIVVDVLPQLTSDLTSLSTQRSSFMKNYCDKIYFDYIKQAKNNNQLSELLEQIKQINSGKQNSGQVSSSPELNEKVTQSYYNERDQKQKMNSDRLRITPKQDSQVKRQPNNSRLQAVQLRPNQQQVQFINQPQILHPSLIPQVQQPVIIQTEMMQNQLLQQPVIFLDQNQLPQQILYQQELQNDQQQYQAVQQNLQPGGVQDFSKQLDQEFNEADQYEEKSLEEINQFQAQKKLIEEVNQELQLCSQNRWQVLSNTNFSVEKISFFLDKKEFFLIKQSLKQLTLTSFDFYETFYINYIKRNLKKISNTINQKSIINYQSQILHYSIVLARLFMKKQLIGVDYEQQGLVNFKMNKGEKVNDFFELFDEAAPNAVVFQQFRKCIPLKQKGTFISFEHKSIQEYLFAKSIFDSISGILLSYQNIKSILIELVSMTHLFSTKQLIVQYFKKCQAISKWKQCKSDEEINNVFKERMKTKDNQQTFEKLLNGIHKIMLQINTSPLNQFTLQSDFYLGSLKFLCDKIKSNYKLRKLLKFLILLSKDFAQYINISSNSFQILVFMQELFKGCNFSNIKIKDIQLIGMKCLGCDFMNSSFSNVKIVGVNLDFCNLSSVNWENIITSELPILYFREPIVKAQFSANGELIAALNNQNKLIINLACNGASIFFISINENDIINDFSWSYTIMQMICLCFNNIVECKIIAPRGIENLQSCRLDTEVVSVKFSKKNNYLACGSVSFVYLLNPNSRNLEIIYKSELFQEITFTSLDFSSDERQLVACGNTSFFIIRNEHNNWILKDKKDKASQLVITNISYSPDGTFFATSSLDCQISIWNKFGVLHRQIKTVTPIWGIHYSPNGSFLACGGEDKTVYLYNPNTGALLGDYKDHTDCIFSVNFSQPYGNTILSASKDCSLRQWHPQINQQLNEYLHGHDEQILFVTITKDQKRIISKGKDKKIIQWNFQTGETYSPFIILNGCINCSNSMLCDDCSKSPILSINNDQQIATGGNGDQIQIIDAYNSKLISNNNNDVKPGQILFMVYHTNINNIDDSNENQIKKQNLIVSYTSQGIIQIHDLIFGKNIQKQYNLEPIAGLFIYSQLNIQQELNSVDQQIIMTIDFNANVNTYQLETLEVLISKKKLENEQIGFTFQRLRAAEYEFHHSNSEKILKVRGINYLPHLNQIQTQKSESDSVICVYAKPEVNYLFVAFNNDTINLYTIDQLEIVFTFKHPCKVQGISYVKIEIQHYFVTYGVDLTFRVYDLSANLQGQHLLCHYDQITGLLGLDDSNYMLSWSNDKSIKIWSVGESIYLQDELKKLKEEITQAQEKLELVQKNNNKYDSIFQVLNKFEENAQLLVSKFQNHLQNKRNLEQDQVAMSDQLQQIQNFQQDLLDIGRMSICGQQFQLKEALEEILQKRSRLGDLTQGLEMIKYRQAEIRQNCFEHLLHELIDFSRYIENLIKDAEFEFKVNQNELQNIKERDLFVGVIHQQQVPQREKQYMFKFQEHLCLSKFPQPTKFIGTKFSSAKIVSSASSDLTSIWMYKQKKFENFSY